MTTVSLVPPLNSTSSSFRTATIDIFRRSRPSERGAARSIAVPFEEIPGFVPQKERRLARRERNGEVIFERRLQRREPCLDLACSRRCNVCVNRTAYGRFDEIAVRGVHRGVAGRRLGHLVAEGHAQVVVQKSLGDKQAELRK